MQRPRNRQPRQGQGQGQGQTSAAGRGGRGRGRGFGGAASSSSRNLPAVPRAAEVVRGARVSIVLKADQGTGREVQGVVGDVLTGSGEHPRGLKVRLSDGRVGRVQRMVSTEGEEEERTSGEVSGGVRRAKFVADVRRAENDMIGNEPPTGYSLGDFLPAGHPLLEGQLADRSSEPESGPIVVCPVCNAFEGDKAAVEHHVSRHFADD